MMHSYLYILVPQLIHSHHSFKKVPCGVASLQCDFSSALYQLWRGILKNAVTLYDCTLDIFLSNGIVCLDHITNFNLLLSSEN